MKKVRMFGMLCFLLLPFLFSCNNENPKPNKPSIEESKLLLKLGNKVTCRDKDGKPVTTGKEVKAGEIYTFTASLVQGEKIDAWYVNDAKKADQNQNTFVYTVVDTDGKPEGNNKAITISFRLKSDEDKGKLLLKFGDKVTCKDLDNQAVTTGKEVKAGEKYTFTAILAQGEEVDTWYVSGVKKEDQKWETFAYTVAVVDGVQESGSKDKAITISFQLKNGGNQGGDEGKLLLKFDPNTCSCIDSKDEEKDNPVEVKVGEVYKFLATPSEGKKVKAWCVNGKEKAGETANEFTYTVVDTDGKTEGKNKVITISFTETKKEKVKIKFDDKIKCSTIGEGNKEVKNNEEVLEGTTLEFTATVEKDKFVYEWLKNDAKIEKAYGKSFEYKVDVKDAKTVGNEKAVTISFKDRDAKKVIIKFDDKKIECDDKNITSGQEFSEGTEITFMPKEGLNVEDAFWYINDKKYMEEREYQFVYVVNDDDAKDDNGKRVIEVDYKEQ